MIKHLTILILITFRLAFSINNKDCTKYFFHKNADSLCTIIKGDKEFLDSERITIIKLTDPQKPYSTPDLQLEIKKNQKVSLLLLNDKKMLIKFLFSKRFDTGKYIIFINKAKLALKNMEKIKLLIIQENEYRYINSIVIR